MQKIPRIISIGVHIVYALNQLVIFQLHMEEIFWDGIEYIRNLFLLELAEPNLKESFS